MENFIPYGRQTITEKDIETVINVLRSDNLTQGPMVPAFEEYLAKKVNTMHGVAVNSATSGLHIACLALGLGEGDYLWTSPITFVASANCGRYCKAKVDFVDIEPNTGLMSIEKLKLKLETSEKQGTLPKVVIPVHLTGTSCPMVEIKKLSEKYGFNIIEDASHAVGGKYNNKPVGCCDYSDITVFSFHPVKIITSGEGGMAMTKNDELAKKMKDLRSHGITKDSARFAYKTGDPWRYEQQDLGFNYRMTDIQAALGLSQSTRLEEIVNERNRLKNKYEELFSTTEGIGLLDTPKDTISSAHLAIIKLRDIEPIKHQSMFKRLRENKIGVQIHYMPVHIQPYYQNCGFKKGDFPNSEKYERSVLSIPLFPGLHEAEQIKIHSLITKLYDE